MPVLFLAYSVLALFSHNVQVINFSDITWILIGAVILGAVLTSLLFIIFRDRSKASLISTCWLIIFFSYGQVYTVIHKSLGPSIGRNTLLLSIAFVLMALSLNFDLETCPGSILAGHLFRWDDCCFVYHDLLFIGTI